MAQLVRNSSFESQPVIEWMTFFNPDGSKSDPNSHQGNFAARLATQAGAAFPAVVFQVIPITGVAPGTTVRLAFHAMKPGPLEENPASNIIVAASFEDAEGTTVVSLPVVIPPISNPGDPDYVAYEAFVEIPEGGETIDHAIVAIVNTAPPAGTSTLLVDDVTLTTLLGSRL